MKRNILQWLVIAIVSAVVTIAAAHIKTKEERTFLDVARFEAAKKLDMNPHGVKCYSFESYRDSSGTTIVVATFVPRIATSHKYVTVRGIVTRNLNVTLAYY